MRHDHGTHALVKADKLPTEDNVDQLARIKWTDRLRLQELIIKHSQIIADLAADNHILHEILHRCRIFMVHLHVLGLVVNYVRIQVRKLFFGKCILIIQIHQYRLRYQIISGEIHTLDKALIQPDKFQVAFHCIPVEPMVLVIQFSCADQHRADT